MTTYAEELRLRAVRPALEWLQLWSLAAEELVLATFAHESGGFKHRVQVGGGPGLGLGQIELATHDDVFTHYLDYAPRHELRSRLLLLKTAPDAHPLAELRDNDNYAAGVCRLIYRRAPEPLPEPHDIAGMAALWKRRYNTPLGKGTVEKFIADYHRYVKPAGN